MYKNKNKEWKGEKKTKKKKSRRETLTKTYIPATQTAYTGPIRTPYQQHQKELVSMTLVSRVVLASDVSGNAFYVYNNDPSGYQDWTSLANLFDEYRCLGMEIVFRPYNRYSKTTVVCLPIYTLFDRDSSGALGSVNAAIQYESVNIDSLEDPWIRTLKMGGDPVQARFISTASPAATFWFKTAVTGLSSSTNYGDLLITLLCQFRGRN